jgi:hypothetical protein
MNYLDEAARAIGDALPEERRPTERAHDLYRLYALLALTTGRETSLENVHDAWSVWMLGIDPSHEALIPFCDLDAETQREDAIYRDVIRNVARARLDHDASG